jgi:hypothetical protein
VIAILEAISNSVSALPAVGSTAPLGAGAPAPGGFAATLAAAQGVSAASQPVPSEAETSEESATGSTGTAPGMNVRMPAGNAPAKKLAGGNPPLTVGVWAAANMVVPGFVPTVASQILPPGPQTNLTQTGVAEAGTAPVVSAQAPSTSGIVPAGVQRPGTQQFETLQSGSQPLGPQTGAYAPAAQNASSAYSAPSLGARTLGALANPDGTAWAQGDPAPRSSLIPGEANGRANGQETSAGKVAQPPVFSATAGGTNTGGVAAPPSAASENPWSGELSFAPPAPTVENPQPPILSHAIASPVATASAGLSAQAVPQTAAREVEPASVGSDLQTAPAPAETALLAENTPPSALSAVNGQSLSTPGWQDVGPATPSSGSPVEGLGSGAGEPTAPAAQNVPVLLASAGSGVGAAARVQSSSGANIPISPANSSSAIAPAEDQMDPAAQAAAGNSLSGILSGAAALPIPNSAAQLTPAKQALRVAAPRATATVTSPSLRSAGASSSAPASILTSTTAAAESGNGAAASQTPFSIFFSSPGPGTESAASTLPKMILPATSSALRDSHIGAADASSVSAPNGGVHGGVSTSNAAQNAAAPNSGDATTGQSGSLSTAQPLHADPTAAPAAVAAAPAVAPPSPAVPGSAGATLPLVQPAATAADALPKPGTAAGTAGNPATPFPVAAEPAPAMATGPVQMAQMVNRVGQAEMRIGVNTSAFGSVEVRTVIHASDVGLTIGSEKGDLRGLLGNEMPALSNSLQQQNLRLSNVSFTQGFSSSGNGAGGGDSQPRSFVPAPVPSISMSSEVAGDDFADLPPLGVFSGGSGGLSILA